MGYAGAREDSRRSPAGGWLTAEVGCGLDSKSAAWYVLVVVGHPPGWSIQDIRPGLGQPTCG